MWRDWDFGFRTRWLLENFDREFEEAEEMLNSMFRTVNDANPANVVVNGPYYYGYQITVGLDGKPRVRKFGNITPITAELVEQSEAREPLVDTVIDSNDNTLIITAEMPGVTKQDIKVKTSQEHVSIHAEKDDKKYHTDIPVDLELDEKSARATFTNGILQLKIKLKAPAKPKQTEIRVE